MSFSLIAVAQHNPESQHHFADMEQQREASSLGIWLFLATEIMFFGGVFCAYLIYRLWYFPEFAAASNSLDIILGTVNIAVLICSSLTVVLAVRAAQIGKRQAQVIYLALTLVLGLAFLGIKAVEWTSKYKEHNIPDASFHFEGDISGHPGQPVDQQHAQIFFSLYFDMTGMHALHMIIGSDFSAICYTTPGKAGTGRNIIRPWKILACIGTLWTSSGFTCFHCCI